MPKRFAKISVVFPALNEEKNIANCLSALLKQTVFPNEVIFVDHNSIDNTLEIAKSFVNKYKIFEYLFNCIICSKRCFNNHFMIIFYFSDKR